MATTAQRQHLHALMSLLLAHEPLCDYPIHDVRGAKDAATFALSREQMHRRLQRGQHLMFDCSGATTLLCKWAGLKDPNGLAYSREGYTGTMLAHLKHYRDPRKAKVGALVVFGPATGDHVAAVMEPGADPLLFSHGSEAGPIAIRLSSERQYHRPPVTFLSIASL